MAHDDKKIFVGVSDVSNTCMHVENNPQKYSCPSSIYVNIYRHVYVLNYMSKNRNSLFYFIPGCCKCCDTTSSKFGYDIFMLSMF